MDRSRCIEAFLTMKKYRRSHPVYSGKIVSRSFDIEDIYIDSVLNDSCKSAQEVNTWFTDELNSALDALSLDTSRLKID